MAVHLLGQALTQDELAELVDILRKNFLYQTPMPVPEKGRLLLAMVPGQWSRMIELIEKHGGWKLPKEAVEALLKEQAEDNGNGETDAEEN